MLKIYLASRYSRREEMSEYAKALQDLGFEIVSTWVKGDRDILGNPEKAKEFATQDRYDLLRADIVINFAEPKEVDYPRGSRHTEFGMAYERGKVCYVVGIHGIELENVFHHLEGVLVYESWDVLLRHLQELGVYAYARSFMDREIDCI
jgi:nucleoside 2-deoxyribosyltransferase